MRYELRPHKWSEDFPHDGGWAEWDTVENRQIGWSRDRSRCQSEVDADNAATVPPPLCESPLAASGHAPQASASPCTP